MNKEQPKESMNARKYSSKWLTFDDDEKQTQPGLDESITQSISEENQKHVFIQSADYEKCTKMSESSSEGADTFSEDKWIFMKATNEIEHYKIVRLCNSEGLVKLSDTNAQKTFIGNKDKRICRFCGKDANQTSFKKIAHAIPQLLGNIRLFSYCECDECNAFFSSKGEDDLAKLLSCVRTIEGFRGKNGVPVYKTGKSFRMEKSGNGINISSTVDHYEVDEEKKTLTLTISSPKFYPINVWRILSKMALSILPETNVRSDFKELLSLIKKRKDEMPYQTGCLNYGYITYPQTIYFPDIQNVFFIRKNDNDILPYSIYAVALKSIILFVMLFSPERDRHLEGQKINFDTKNFHKYFYRIVTDDNIEITPLHFFKVKDGEQVSLTLTPQFSFTEMKKI